ncbi:MAG: metal ABC transporter ATP-binding protein [Candidatus Andersenbacteria bacterium]
MKAVDSNTPALAVKDLSVVLDGYPILENISFTIPQGSTAAIIGPNGAGKSVLVKSILRLIPKAKGEVEILGINHRNYRKAAALVSYIPQYLDFDREFPLTVEGLFALKSARPLGMTEVERERMHTLLRMVGMKEHLHKKLSALSGGQLQRTLIAYSLMDHPKILFMDEPSAGIDVQGQETIYSLLERIQKEEHLTMVLVSHELDIVMQYADQVLCLNKELLCAGIPKKVLTNEILERMYGTPVGHVAHGHAKH